MLELFSKQAIQKPKDIILIMGFSFTMSELLPLSLVVYGVYLQIDWKRIVFDDQGLKRDCTDLTDSGRDEAIELLDDEIEKSLKINPEDSVARISNESRQRSECQSEEDEGPGSITEQFFF